MRDDPPVPATGMDWISFTVAFKGVLLEGLEVAFIVVTFGASAGQFGPAALGAALAGVLVLLVGLAVRRPLARVPENGLKFVVGLMLTTFGVFWAGEGIGVKWIAEKSYPELHASATNPATLPGGVVGIAYSTTVTATVVTVTFDS